MVIRDVTFVKLQILVNLEAKIFRSDSRSEHRSLKKSTFKLNGLLNNHYVKNYRAVCPDITNYLLTYLLTFNFEQLFGSYSEIG